MKKVKDMLKELEQELTNEPFVELSEKQRQADCFEIGSVCMTHARDISICNRIKQEETK